MRFKKFKGFYLSNAQYPAQRAQILNPRLTLKQCRGHRNSKFKISTTSDKNNANTNIPSALAGFSIISLTILSVLLLKLSLKTYINHKKLPVILSTRRKLTNLMFWRFFTGNWFQILFYFICANNEKTDQLGNIENFTLFYFVIFKLFFLSEWTLGRFVKVYGFSQ